jgi:putative proteasome-type protease
MTYCLGIKTQAGLVLASDSRTNSGLDQVNVCRKMHTFIKPGEHVLVLLSSGGLSLTQSVLAMLHNDYQAGRGLAAAATMYDAARCVGDQVRKVAELDRAALERDSIPFNIHFLLGGQYRGREHDLYLIYPQGNPLRVAHECPFLQIGETKYGRPILDRGVRYEATTLEEAAKYAMISLDSCMRSNLTVGPPIDLAVYAVDELRLRHERRYEASDPLLVAIRTQWELALRQAVQKLPGIDLPKAGRESER